MYFFVCRRVINSDILYLTKEKHRGEILRTYTPINEPYVTRAASRILYLSHVLSALRHCSIYRYIRQLVAYFNEAASSFSQDASASRLGVDARASVGIYSVIFRLSSRKNYYSGKYRKFGRYTKESLKSKKSQMTILSRRSANTVENSKCSNKKGKVYKKILHCGMNEDMEKMRVDIDIAFYIRLDEWCCSLDGWIKLIIAREMQENKFYKENSKMF